MKNKTPTKECEIFPFLESTVKVLHKKTASDNDVKNKMRYLSQVIRRVFHHYNETFEEFTPVALFIEKPDKIYLLSKDKVKKEINVKGLDEFFKQFSGLAAPKVIHISEISKIEKMLEKDETVK